MLAFVFSTQLGNLVYLLPIAGCIILVLTGVVSSQEASCTLAGDMVFCVAGVLVVSSALNSSGAGQLIGDFGKQSVQHPGYYGVLCCYRDYDYVLKQQWNHCDHDTDRSFDGTGRGHESKGNCFGCIRCILPGDCIPNRMRRSDDGILHWKS